MIDGANPAVTSDGLDKSDGDKEDEEDDTDKKTAAKTGSKPRSIHSQSLSFMRY